jgi:hypothetical protein
LATGRRMTAADGGRPFSSFHSGRSAEIQRAPQTFRWDGQLEPTEPIARATTMRCNHENLDVTACQPIENVVRKAWHPVAPNARGKLDTIPLRVLTDLDHCSIEGGEVTCPQSPSLFFIVGDVLKVFYPSRIAEEIAHLSRAWACRRTSSAATRFINPRSISAARRAASSNQSCSISLSERASRLERSCSANSARS